MQTHAKTGTYHFVDGLSLCCNAVSLDDALLRLLYNEVAAALDTDDTAAPVLLIDDLSALLWLGLSSLDVADFYRAAKALCMNVRCLEDPAVATQIAVDSATPACSLLFTETAPLHRLQKARLRPSPTT